MVRLVPMEENEFQEFLAQEIADYAQEHVKGGRWSSEEALEESRKEFDRLLPAGLASPNNYFFMIEDETIPAKVGLLWFAVREQAGKSLAFVYDVVVFEQVRRHGYGTQAFLAMEDKVKELGLDTISLHVFGHNHAAWDMYKKLGYVETNVVMVKKLS